MNPSLDKLNFRQLLDMFMQNTRKFIAALENKESFTELKKLRDKIKRISRAIEIKKQELKTAS